MGDDKSEVLQGTLDLMVLKTLDVMGALHGYGIGQRIAQISDDTLQINPGTVYLCLVRLQQQKFIAARWGISENNRRAKFYSVTAAGRRRLVAETAQWDRVASVMGRILQQRAR
ncbi:MAG TPA: PadR family transcriptional regulator [Luteitalea sp.]|nr:PadR family transcriptional regulator [Luteitalea sp.]